MNALAKSWWAGPDADPATRFCFAIVSGDLVMAKDALAASRALADPPAPPARPLHLLRDREAPLAWRLIRTTRCKDATLLQEAALYAATHGHNHIVKLLLKAGAEIDAVDMYGYAALHQAALTNNAAACRMLLDAGATIDLQSGKGYTPLHTAIFKRCNESAALLLERGASLKLTNRRGESPLEYAMRHDRREIMAKLRAAAAKRAAERALRRLARQ